MTLEGNWYHLIWKKPNIRQEWGAEQDTEKVGWGELFFDLIFVAMTGSLAHHLIRNHSPYDVVFYFAVWVVFYITWGDLSFYMTRFSSDGLLTDATLFCFTLSVCFMVVHASLENFTRFNIACALSKVFLSGLYLQVYLTIPRAEYFSMVMGTGSFISGLCFLLTCFFPSLNVYWWYGTAAAAYIYADIAFSKGPEYSIPINIEHYSERVGLLVMLILGESIISITTSNMDPSLRGSLIVAFGYLTVFSSKTMYFGAQPSHHDFHLHALRTSVTRGRSFVWLHMFLTFFILGVGAGLKLMATQSLNATVPEHDVWFLAFNSVGLIIFMNLVRLTHNFHDRPVSSWTVRVLLAVVGALLPFVLHTASASTVVVAYGFVFMMLNGVDFFNKDHTGAGHSHVMNEALLQVDLSEDDSSEKKHE